MPAVGMKIFFKKVSETFPKILRPPPGDYFWKHNSRFQIMSCYINAAVVNLINNETKTNHHTQKSRKLNNR